MCRPCPPNGMGVISQVFLRTLLDTDRSSTQSIICKYHYPSIYFHIKYPKYRQIPGPHPLDILTNIDCYMYHIITKSQGGTALQHQVFDGTFHYLKCLFTSLPKILRNP